MITVLLCRLEFAVNFLILIAAEALMKYNSVKLVMARIGIVTLDATFRLAKKAPLPTESIMIDITE